MSLKFKSVFSCVLILGLLVACQKTESPSPEGEKSGDLHAASDVKHGSHEDWCGEHQVPESMCTRCNSSLIPAFKATGDWCAQHNMPDSQCLACHPDLKIVRPPKTAEKP